MAKEYKDPKGNIIASKYLHKEQRDAHSTVSKAVKTAEAIHKKLKDFKTSLLADCDELYDAMLEKEQITKRENSRGSFSFTTIDKELKVEVRVAQTVSFDNKIDLAKEKIMAYVDDITNKDNKELRTLISEAFSTSRGKLDVKKIIGLAKLKIDHPLWKDGVRLINESMDINYSKRYVNISKKDKEGVYQSITLDLSSI